MFVLLRALTWSALFIGVVLFFLPARLLGATGVERPAVFGFAQAMGMLAAASGAALAAWCIATFALRGKGTPLPLDPPRRLVVQGPYAHVRNPMYIGATLALAGAAVFYRSLALAGYAGGFLALTHVLVIGSEEPALRAAFGADYEAYCRRVRRWWPRLR